MSDMHVNMDSNFDDELALFQAYVDSCPNQSVPVDLLDFAAWLDGRLDPAQAAAFESHLARDPRARQLLHEIRCGEECAPEMVSEAALQRLKRLPADLLAPHSIASVSRIGTPSRSWLMPTAAAAAIAFALLGFVAGQRTAHDYRMTEAQFLATATFDVFQSGTTSDLDSLFATQVNMESDR